MRAASSARATVQKAAETKALQHAVTLCKNERQRQRDEDAKVANDRRLACERAAKTAADHKAKTEHEADVKANHLRTVADMIGRNRLAKNEVLAMQEAHKQQEVPTS